MSRSLTRSSSFVSFAALAAIACTLLGGTATAERARKATRKSVSDCTSFDQRDHGEDGVSIEVSSSCTVPLTCKVSWAVVCAPDSRKRRSVKKVADKFEVSMGDRHESVASAAVCGDDAWAIQDLTWSCAPSE